MNDIYTDLNDFELINTGPNIEGLIYIPIDATTSIEKIITLGICRLQNEAFKYTFGLDFNGIKTGIYSVDNLFELLNFVKKTSSFKIFFNFEDALNNIEFIFNCLKKYTNLDIVIKFERFQLENVDNLKKFNEIFKGYLKRFEYFLYLPEVLDTLIQPINKYVLKYILSKDIEKPLFIYSNSYQEKGLLRIFITLSIRDSRNKIIDLFNF